MQIIIRKFFFNFIILISRITFCLLIDKCAWSSVKQRLVLFKENWSDILGKFCYIMARKGNVSNFCLTERLHRFPIIGQPLSTICENNVIILASESFMIY